MLVNRRAFLVTGGTAAAGALIVAPAAAQKATGLAKPGFPPPDVDPKGRRIIYRLSLRGRRGSNFAKRYNASMRFATRAAVVRAHPGDRSRVVPLTVGVEEYHRLFVSRHALVADLRKLGA